MLPLLVAVSLAVELPVENGVFYRSEAQEDVVHVVGGSFRLTTGVLRDKGATMERGYVRVVFRLGVGPLAEDVASASLSPAEARALVDAFAECSSPEAATVAKVLPFDDTVCELHLERQLWLRLAPGMTEGTLSVWDGLSWPATPPFPAAKGAELQGALQAQVRRLEASGL